MYAVNMGGTAVGTALNANPAYVEALAPELAKITGLPLVKADDLVDGTQNLDAYAYVSASLKTCAISCSKMANDFRLMSSGSTLWLPGNQPACKTEWFFHHAR